MSIKTPYLSSSTKKKSSNSPDSGGVEVRTAKKQKES